MNIAAFSQFAVDGIILMMAFAIAAFPRNCVFAACMDGDERLVRDISRRVSSVYYMLFAAFLFMDIIILLLFGSEFPLPEALLVKAASVFAVEKYYGYRAAADAAKRRGLGVFGKRSFFPRVALFISLTVITACTAYAFSSFIYLFLPLSAAVFLIRERRIVLILYRLFFLILSVFLVMLCALTDPSLAPIALVPFLMIL